MVVQISCFEGSQLPKRSILIPQVHAIKYLTQNTFEYLCLGSIRVHALAKKVSHSSVMLSYDSKALEPNLCTTMSLPIRQFTPIVDR